MRGALGGTMFRLTLLTIFTVTATSASAWYADVTGPDVFGKTIVLAGEEGRQSTLVIQCDSAGTLLVAVIRRKKEFEEVSDAAATIYFTVSEAAPTKLSAHMKAWNDNYMGVVADAPSAELIPIVKAIRDAKAEIKIGFEINGNQVAENLSSSGSTAAMNKVISGCKIAVD